MSRTRAEWSWRGRRGSSGRRSSPGTERLAGRQVDLVGRREATTWDDPEALTALIDGASAVVNLAGKSVNCRYGLANRAEILRSRVETTRALATTTRSGYRK